MNKCLWWLWELFCLTAFGTEGKDLIILLVLFPLLPPCTWVCRREWLRTWTCSLLRSVTGLQVIKDVKKPTIFIWKSSSTRALRVLWPYKGAAGYRGAYIPQTAGLSLADGLGMWSRKLKTSSGKRRIEGKRVGAGGLCVSGVPHPWLEAVPSTEGANTERLVLG